MNIISQFFNFSGSRLPKLVRAISGRKVKVKRGDLSPRIENMKPEYDLSKMKSRKNPYVGKLKK